MKFLYKFMFKALKINVNEIKKQEMGDLIYVFDNVFIEKEDGKKESVRELLKKVIEN